MKNALFWNVEEERMSTKMNFKQFLDVVLTEIYKAEKDHGAGEYYDLPPLLSGVDYPSGWLSDAVDVLTSQGYITSQKFLGGGCMARLTGNGRLKKEDGGQAGFVKEYETNPNQYHVTIQEDKNTVVMGVQATATVTIGSNQVSVYLDEVKKALSASKIISENEKADIKLDLDTIDKQLQKHEPNKGLAVAVLEGLVRYSDLVKPVRKLLDFIDSVL